MDSWQATGQSCTSEVLYPRNLQIELSFKKSSIVKLVNNKTSSTRVILEAAAMLPPEFYHCTGLTLVIFKAQTPPSLNYCSFGYYSNGIYDNATLYVPGGTVNAYVFYLLLSPSNSFYLQGKQSLRKLNYRRIRNRW